MFINWLASKGGGGDGGRRPRVRPAAQGLRGDCLTPPLPPSQGIPLSPAPDHPWQLPAFLPHLSKWLQPQAASKLLTSNPGLCRGLWPLKKKKTPLLLIKISEEALKRKPLGQRASEGPRRLSHRPRTGHSLLLALEGGPAGLGTGHPHSGPTLRSSQGGGRDPQKQRTAMGTRAFLAGASGASGRGREGGRGRNTDLAAEAPGGRLQLRTWSLWGSPSPAPRPAGPFLTQTPGRAPVLPWPQHSSPGGPRPPSGPSSGRPPSRPFLTRGQAGSRGGWKDLSETTSEAHGPL